MRKWFFKWSFGCARTSTRPERQSSWWFRVRFGYGRTWQAHAARKKRSIAGCYFFSSHSKHSCWRSFQTFWAASILRDLLHLFIFIREIFWSNFKWIEFLSNKLEKKSWTHRISDELYFNHMIRKYFNSLINQVKWCSPFILKDNSIHLIWIWLFLTFKKLAFMFLLIKRWDKTDKFFFFRKTQN